MRTVRSLILLILLTAMMLLGVACGPRATAGATMDMTDDSTSAVDLPSLVIDYDTAGIPSTGGVPLSDLAGLFGFSQEAVASLQLTPELITQFTKANIQHAQLDNATDGIILLVNGQPIPTLVWDENSLVAMSEVLDMTGFGIEGLETVLPLVKTMGVGTIVRFPIAADADLIPAVVSGEGSVSQTVQQAQEAFAATVGESAAQIQIIVQYDDAGEWTVADLDATQWSQVVPAPWEDLNLSPVLIGQLTEAGISEIAFSTTQDGIFVAVNGKKLPYIGWSQGELQHLINLIMQPDILAYLTGNNGSNFAGLQTVIEQWLPVLQTANTRLSVRFP